MPHLSIELLGPPRASLGGVEVADFGYAKVRALLAYLAAERGRAHERDQLAELLWPDQPPQAGRSSLRQALAMLRRAIGDQAADPPLLLAGRETVQLNPAADWSVDTAEFAGLLAASAAHGHGPELACAECLARWERAAALYRGPFAEGLAPRASEEFEGWLIARREWFAQQHMETLERLAARHEAAGDHARALEYGRRQIAADPWREPAHRLVMRALAALGQRGAALAQYERCRQILQAELGVAPEPETTALMEQIRAERPPSPAPAQPPEPAPPARAALPAPALPLQPTSFIGRARELAELRALLGRPEARLITLLGPGGIGKTRLALRLAELAGQAGEVIWLALDALATPADMLDALCRALGIAGDAAGDRRALLLEAARPRELLLVLDNLEHLLAGAGLVGELLAAAPGLRVLATSRERLQLRWEWVYDLGGLGLGAGEAGEAEAVQLLLERAAQAPGPPAPEAEELAAARRIARDVEGTPLALELAAAARRSRPFAAIAAAIEHDLGQLRAALRDLPERHRSMRAALEYSWRLLSPDEQGALARLSVFRGGLSAEAAERVAGADEWLLDGLADKSLLRRSDGRYDLHALVRRFAAERLAAAGLDEQARAEHLAYAVELAEAAEPRLTGAEQERWLDRLEQEHPNLRAALGWAIERGRAEPAQRLAAALTRFWWMRGYQREGRDWLERALLLAEPEGDDPERRRAAQAARARALHGAGGLALQQSDFPAARELLGQSLALERPIGRKAELARLLTNLALVEINLGAYAPAEALLEECLALDRELGDTRGVAFDLGNLAQMAFFQLDYPRALALCGESLALHRQAGDQHSQAIMLLNMGGIRRLLGHAAEARALFDEAAGLFRAIGGAFGLAVVQLNQARLRCQSGDLAGASALAAECLPQMAAFGYGAGLAGALSLLGDVAMAAGDPARGARLWGAAVRLVEQATDLIEPPERIEHAERRAAAWGRVAAAGLADEWEAGRSMGTESAVAYALGRTAPPL